MANKSLTPTIDVGSALIVLEQMIDSARAKIIKTANVQLIDLYWNIGHYLCERCSEAGWGKATVQSLADLIQKERPTWRGFSSPNLWRMKQFYETYSNEEKLSTLLRELPWSANLHILGKCKSMEERQFYIELAIQERWNVREIERQIDGALFERKLTGAPILSTVLREIHPTATNIFKDRYLVDFVDLPTSHSENDLQRGLIANLKKFLLELGRDFCFIDNEFPLQISNKDYYIDLLLFHRGLNCLVAVELKIDDFKPEYIGKLDFYLEALDRYHRKPHENPSVGVLLCKGHDRETVEIALSRSLSPALVAEYETKLIDKKLLEQKLHELYEQSEKE